ncbi:hypothetical protein V5O48_015392 [Marasmius crinis-equi]|uniref:Uncharacterized protein n=1 Tax=Marasmius crinis-equi TaxID=585013 RepID=A0ABR3EUQ5_9AGAR
MAMLEPELFAANKTNHTNDVQLVQPARMSTDGFVIFVVARVDNVLSCSPYDQLYQARTAYHSLVDHEAFAQLYLARSHVDATEEFEKEEKAYSLAIQSVIEGVDYNK